ncbi:dephospho-CoA kinase [Solitalea koreensis]|uniref:Dephospho-CoA kinase n=1 Tax=Solitalea koreensis TaxID=543615 RepID=A0A521D945_9SPHI|nr:dephospho-CoA kinase [Solitalea koreensis]SMO67611.1 dephospho-CoA kinase [Solitalea koreensis]
MLKIGITGGIGSGKSTVSKIFALLGIPVFYADEQAKSLMTTDALLIQAIKANFGEDVYDEHGKLYRAKLASIVFNDAAQLKLLNSLVHPAVINAGERWVKQQMNCPYVIKEAALMFESNSYKYNDYNLIITAPEDLRIQRVMLRDAASEEQVRSRIEHQMPENEKIKMADFIINNDETIAVIPQIMALHHRFTKQLV